MIILYLSLFLLIVYYIPLAFATEKERGWPNMQSDIEVLANNACFHNEWKEIIPIISEPEDSFYKKIALYRLVIEILVRFDPDQKHLRYRLRKLRYEDELKFEEELKRVVEEVVPETYRKN